jgi:SRSO17 transposase
MGGGSIPHTSLLLLKSVRYLYHFKDVLKSGSYSLIPQALDYVKGLYHCSKKKATCTGMEQHLGERNAQSHNHFISQSHWNWQKVMDKIALKCYYFFVYFLGASREDICLIIDEVGFKKAGKFSACASRQWLGCLGKQDLGQVAVAALLSHKNYFSLICTRLFMPESWEDDLQRRKKTYIPKEIKHKTKPAMALDMINHIDSLGVKYGWIIFDALYGNTLHLLYALSQLSHRFMAEVKINLRIYLELPNIEIPQSGKSGRKPQKMKADKADISIKDYCKTLEDKDWTEITIRDGTKKKITSLYHLKKIWIWNERQQERKPLSCYLLVRKSMDGSDLKFCLTNATEDTPLKELAYAQGQRFYIEQAFKEGKNQVGMGDYQVRGWDGFHHHMACSMMALNFMMEQKHFYKKEMPHVTGEDIRQMIIICFPPTPLTKEQQLADLKRKHDQYQHQIKMNLARESKRRSAM